MLGIAAAPDLQHFSACDAFRIRQIGSCDQSPTQRNRIHHAQNSSECADPKRSPERKLSPIADHDQTRQNENNGGQSACRGGNRLDNIVLLNRRVAETTQDRHRNDGCGDRRRKSKAGLETEVYIGCGKHQCDGDANNQAANGKFGRAVRAHFLIGFHDTTSNSLIAWPATMPDQRERRIVWNRRKGQDVEIHPARGASFRRRGRRRALAKSEHLHRRALNTV